MNLWNDILSTCTEPKTNREIMAAMSSGILVYTDVCDMTRIMAMAGVLDKSVDPNQKRGFKYQTVSGLQNCGMSAGIERRDSAHKGIKNKYILEIEALRALADRLIRENGFCTTDMLRKENAGRISVPPQAWGAVFKAKGYRARNRQPSSIKTNNGRYICEWVRS